MNYLTWGLIICLSRVLPHPPGFTPLISLTVIAASRFRLCVMLGVLFMTLFLSDTLTGLLLKQPLYGSWMWFTYTGMAMIALATACCAPHSFIKNPLMLTVCAVLFDWAFTNFGTFLLTTWYTKNLQGFLVCYLRALPFLRWMLLSSILTTVIFSFFESQTEIWKRQAFNNL